MNFLADFFNNRKIKQYFQQNGSYLPLERMAQSVEQWHQSYVKAEPFPHIVIDDFFNEAILNKVNAEFTHPDDQAGWSQFRNMVEWHKNATKHDLMIPFFTRHLIYEMNAKPFINFLEQLTGIMDLLPDTELEGGGLHSVLPRGSLEVHADFNSHPKTQFTRKLNVLLYLNKDWPEEYGGNLELWDPSMTRMVKTVPPIFNRLVVFNTTSDSFHGHPHPLSCPDDRFRKSIAMYYYTNETPDQTHSTIYKMRPTSQPSDPLAGFKKKPL